GYEIFGSLRDYPAPHGPGLLDQDSLSCISGDVGCAHQARSAFCWTGLRTTRMNGLRKSARRGALIRLPSDVQRAPACDTRSMSFILSTLPTTRRWSSRVPAGVQTAGRFGLH